MDERRRDRRVLIRRTVDVFWDDGCAQGWGQNIGFGGMYVQSEQCPQVGANVRLTVRFHRAPIVSIPARVCRTNDAGFAVNFEALEQAATDTIRKVVGSP
jgi:hypothetical protein